MFPRAASRSIHLVVAIVGVTMTQPFGLIAQSPSPAATPAPATTPASVTLDGDPSVSRSPAPLSGSFPWPTLLSPEQVPVPPPFETIGPPAATRTRHGVRLELWLSSPMVAPGAWIQALVRTTNLGTNPAWSWSGECGSSGTWIGIDLASVIPTGVEQTGNAAVFKARAIRAAHVMESGFTSWEHLPSPPSTSVVGRVYAECTTPHIRLRLKPGATLEERFAWYPTGLAYGDTDLFQPLPPGTVTATAAWPYMGRGERPRRRPRRHDDVIRPITATATLELTGSGPGAPSVPELIDIALADPAFRAWVDEDPTRASWSGVSVNNWPGPTYEHHLWLRDLEGAPATGVVTVELDREPLRRGIVSMDPWTGKVLQVLFL